MILFIIGIIIHLLLFNAYDDISLISAILYHYSKLDIRFLMSLLFSIYWLNVLYKYVFQYLDIDTYIQIRLNFKEKIRFYIQRTLLFTILYIIAVFSAFCNRNSHCRTYGNEKYRITQLGYPVFFVAIGETKRIPVAKRRKNGYDIQNSELPEEIK